MVEAYLTIDDSPSERTDDLVDFLKDRNVPALLFVRGDSLELNLAPIQRAIQKGFLIGNHGYAHKRASAMSDEENYEDMRKCDALIDMAYAQTGIRRPAKYYRFAYMDRGMGSWLAEDNMPAEFEAAHRELLRFGLGHEPRKPDHAARIKMQRLQKYLADLGYEPVPFKNIMLPWVAQTEMAHGIDALCTYSTSDWMLTARHMQKDWPYKTLQDLKTKIEQDPALAMGGSAHIILAHDQAELFEPVCDLIDHFLRRGLKFLDF